MNNVKKKIHYRFQFTTFSKPAPAFQNILPFHTHRKRVLELHPLIMSELSILVIPSERMLLISKRNSIVLLCRYNQGVFPGCFRIKVGTGTVYSTTPATRLTLADDTRLDSNYMTTDQ